MKIFVRRAGVWLLSLLLTPLCASLAAPALAQYAPPAPAAYSQQDLDRLLAPIALYPDPLLSQILVASTRPMEVVEASRWLRANPGLSGDAAVRAAAHTGWHPSVQSLAAFPQILAMMEEHFEWMQSLGLAFLAQEPYVMETVQALRQRAYAAGNLQNNEQIAVYRHGPQILIELARPQLVYVPYYDPLLVYGTWWHPLAPFRWRPWPGYAGRHGGFYWGRPVQVTPEILVARPDWQRRRIVIVEDARIGRSAPRVWSSESRPEPRVVQPVIPQARIERNEARPEIRRPEPHVEPRREPRPESRPHAHTAAQQTPAEARMRLERGDARPALAPGPQRVDPRPEFRPPERRAEERRERAEDRRERADERRERIGDERRERMSDERRERRSETRPQPNASAGAGIPGRAEAREQARGQGHAEARGPNPGEARGQNRGEAHGRGKSAEKRNP